MEIVTTLIWLAAAILTLIGCIPYGIWLIRTAIQKRWKRLIFQIIIPVMAYAILMVVTSLANKHQYNRDLQDCFDTKVNLKNPLYEYNSERGFNGDGYSISVYELPASIRERFESADERLMKTFPVRPDYREHWNSEHWHKSPFDPQFAKYLEFALARYLADDSSQIVAYHEAIQKALDHPGCYYSFFYNNHDEDVGDIDFFVVDLINNRLYMINHNT